MPNVTAKVDYFFQDTSGQAAGWTETTYIVSPDLDQALADAISDAYVVPRLNLLHSSYQMQSVRVSDIAVRGDSKIGVMVGSSGQGMYDQGRADNVAEMSEEPYDGVLIRLETGARNRRMFIMRGLPINIIRRNRAYQPEAQWLNVFPLWSGAVVTGVRWNILTRTLTPLPAPSAIEVAGDQRSLILTWLGAVPPTIIAPSPTTMGSTLRVSKEPDAWLTNKLWRVDRIVGDAVYTRPGRRRIRGVPSVPLFVDLVNYQPGGVTNVTPLEGRSRKTGRPSDLLRGRRAMAVA